MKSEIKIELKYCERCGGLWLRPAGSSDVYCVACAPAMREMAPPRMKPDSTHPWRKAPRVFGGAACA